MKEPLLKVEGLKQYFRVSSKYTVKAVWACWGVGFGKIDDWQKHYPAL